MKFQCTYSKEAHKKSKNRRWIDGTLDLNSNRVVCLTSEDGNVVLKESAPKDADVAIADGDEIDWFVTTDNIIIQVSEPVSDGPGQQPQQQQPRQYAANRPPPARTKSWTAPKRATTLNPLPSNIRPIEPQQLHIEAKSFPAPPQPQPVQPAPTLPMQHTYSNTRQQMSYAQPPVQQQQRSADEIMNLLCGSSGGGVGQHNNTPFSSNTGGAAPVVNNNSRNNAYIPPQQGAYQSISHNTSGPYSAPHPPFSHQQQPQQQQNQRQSWTNAPPLHNNNKNPAVVNTAAQQQQQPQQYKAPNPAPYKPYNVAQPPPPPYSNNAPKPQQQPQQQQPAYGFAPAGGYRQQPNNNQQPQYGNNNNAVNRGGGGYKPKAFNATTSRAPNNSSNSNNNSNNSKNTGGLGLALKLPSVEECSRPRRLVSIPDTFTAAAGYSTSWTNALVEEVNLRCVEVAQRFHSALNKIVGPQHGGNGVGDVARLEAQLRQAGVSYYGHCELFMWRNTQNKIKDYFSAGGKKKGKRARDGDGEDEDVEESTGPHKPFSFYLTLNSSKFRLDQFRKHDMWLISNNPFLQSGFKAGQPGDRTKAPWVTVARSLWHGANKDGKFEVQLLSSVPPNLVKTQPVYALKGPDVSTELSLIDLMTPDSLSKLPLLPHILGLGSKQQNQHQQQHKMAGGTSGGGVPRSPLATLAKNNNTNNPNGNSNTGPAAADGTVGVEADKMAALDPDAQAVIDRFNLNEEQAGVICAVSEWGKSPAAQGPLTNSPFLKGGVCLVHGPFGTGKSTLLVALLHYVLKKRTQEESGLKGCRVLVSAHTNVAVDRVLEGLLESGCSDFLRLGSLKRISRQLFPHSLHCSDSNGSSNAVSELKEMLKNTTNPAERGVLEAELMAAEQGADRKRKRLLKTVPVVGVTCCSSSLHVLDGLQFDLVILDECSQIIEPLSLAPIIRAGAKFLVAAGDPLQLPPVVASPASITAPNNQQKHGVLRPLFSRLASVSSYPPHFLRRQYRCHPDISAIANACFYGGRLIDGCSTDNRKSLLPGLPNVNVLDVRGQEASSGRSLSNQREATAVVTVVKQLLGLGLMPSQIGIICLYRAQAGLLQSMLASVSSNVKVNKMTRRDTIDDDEDDDMDEPANQDDDSDDNGLLNVRRPANGNETDASNTSSKPEVLQVATVDAFQGAERDIILLSTTTTNPGVFAGDACRMNVALTRAKKNLILVGHALALEKGGGEAFQRLIVGAKANGGFCEGGALPLRNNL